MIQCVRFSRSSARFLSSTITQALQPTDILTVKRTVFETAKRTVATQLLLTRWGIEASLHTLPQTASPEDFVEEKERIMDSHNALQMAVDRVDSKIFTRLERSLMSKAVGTWDPLTDIGRVQSRWESFAILLWSLRIFKNLAPYTESVDERTLFEATAIIPSMPQTIDSFQAYFESGEGAKDGHYVSDADFIHQINTAEAWFWRSQAQIVVRLKKKREEGIDDDTTKNMPGQLKSLMKNIDLVIRQASVRAIDAKLVKESVDGDFDVNGRAYAELSEDVVTNLAVVASKRLEALAWLSGRHEWDVEPGSVQFLNPINSLWAPV